MNDKSAQSTTRLGPGAKPVVEINVTPTTPAPGNPDGAGIETTTTVAPPSGLPATRPAAPVPAERNPVMLTDEDIGVEDLSLPAVNVGQGVGDLGAAFGLGSIILGQQFLLADGPKGDAVSQPVYVIFLGFRRVRYAEKTKGGTQGRIYPDERSVYENGGTTNYNESNAAQNAPPGSKPYFEKLASAVLLVRAPKGEEDPEANPDEAFFPFSDGAGNHWGIAVWHLRASAFTSVAKALFLARKVGILKKGGFASRQYRLTTKRKTFGEGRSAFVPSVEPVAPADGDKTGGVPLALVADTYRSLFGAVPKEFGAFCRAAGVDPEGADDAATAGTDPSGQ